MRAIVSVLFVVVLALPAVSHAQPGQTAPAPYAPPPQGPYAPPPGPYAPPPQGPYAPAPGPYAPPAPGPYAAPPPYGYPQQVPLTAEEHELLERGEISEGAHIGGGLIALFMPFGVGQAVQGRWSDTGWIFTLGEAASITAIIVGVVQSVDDCHGGDFGCSSDNDGLPLLITGLVGIAVFRIWEVVDAFAGPAKHNGRVRDLRMRLGIPQPMYSRALPYVAPTGHGGGTAGLTFRF